MKKSLLKNIIIIALGAGCTILAVQLWFGTGSIQGFFDDSPHHGAANPVLAPMVREMVRPARVAAIDEAREISIAAYSMRGERPKWLLAQAIIRAMMENGTQAGFGRPEDAPPLYPLSIRLEYFFFMPAGVFGEHFGESQGFFAPRVGSFNRIAIAPCNEPARINLRFFDDANHMFYDFFFHDQELFIELRLFLSNLDDSKAKPPPQIVAANPIGELRLGTVRPFINFFFPNPDGIRYSIVNNVYTYRDNLRVVKFYPDNVVEFSSFRQNSTTADFTASLLAALHMVSRDRAAMDALGAPMNEVFLAATSFDTAANEWVFYFDYVYNDAPVALSSVFKGSMLNHAIEVRVLDNFVVRYRRLMIVLESEGGEEAQ